MSFAARSFVPLILIERALNMSDQAVTYLIHCIIENEGAASIPPLTTDLIEELAYKDIAAVVRKLDAGNTARLLNSDEEQVQNLLAAYQQTNIDVFRHCTMLPLRFGIMVDRKDEVEDFLTFSYIHIKGALDRLRGKAEFAVQLSWNLNAVLQEISQDAQWLGRAKESINLPDKIEMGRLLFEAADRKKKEIVESVHRKLSEVSLDSSAGRGDDESVIMNRSYLIEEAAEDSLDKAMAELGKENGSYLSFKYVGPIPPYSFAPLQFKLGNFELIDHARGKLLLPERASFEEIKASYRRLSLKYHPDKDPSDSSGRFKQINEAYTILEAYCYSCGGSLAPRDKYSFAEDDVAKVFIVHRKADR